MSDSFRKESRGEKFRYDKPLLSVEDLALGCQQRGADALELIATATEAMAKNHAEVSQERDKFRRWWNEAQDEVKKQAHIIAGLRGCVARMRRRAKGTGE